MSWKKLELWKRLGIIFFLAHLAISLILFNFYYRGEYNLSSLFAMSVDFPLFLLAIKAFRSLLFENVLFYRTYFTIFGSILYGCIGILIGLIIQKIKSRR